MSSKQPNTSAVPNPTLPPPAWQTLRLEGEGYVRTLVLNRPDIHNGINRQMLQEICAAVSYLEGQENCRVVILRGEGKSFCSGADLQEGLTHGGSLQQKIYRSRLGGRAVRALVDAAPITIAAVHGVAIGGGVSLASACDFRLGSTDVKVSVREVNLGVSLSWNTIGNLLHLVGPARARQMILFGEFHSAQTLHEWGFFDRLVKTDSLLAKAMEMANQLADQPPLALRMAKKSINALLHALDPAVLHLDEYGLGLTGNTQDASNAVKAFFNNTKPTWKFE